MSIKCQYQSLHKIKIRKLQPIKDISFVCFCFMFFCFFLFFFWQHPMPCVILVPRPGVEPGSLTVRAESSPLDLQGIQVSSFKYHLSPNTLKLIYIRYYLSNCNVKIITEKHFSLTSSYQKFHTPPCFTMFFLLSSSWLCLIRIKDYQKNKLFVS